MFDYAERYGHHFVKLVDSRATDREFEFDQMLLMPTHWSSVKGVLPIFYAEAYSF